ncbi:alpha-galactosidase [Mucilaginibacter galii]|uniref:alpha-galactosidase n=1 Tax=Mucilaginibacter galii TaxID=2005073 RepID=UPI001E640989|nr:alpha-galactosidase [Mucilaginibacter galii]
MYKLISLFMLLCCLLCLGLTSYSKAVSSESARAQSNIIQMRYGKTGIIKYNLSKGIYSVTYGVNAFINNAYAQATANGDSLSSVNYKTRKYSSVSLHDSFGNGTKHIITLTGGSVPSMQQIFYTYPNRNYFFTQLVVSGKALASNYMAPLIAEFASLGNTERSVFIPFDNDTFISYDAKDLTSGVTNTSAEVGVVYNASRTGIVSGSVEHTVWKTGVSIANLQNVHQLKVWAGYASKEVTRDTVAHGMVKGAVLRSPKIMVGYFVDWRTGLEAYGRSNRIAEPPFVFNWTKATPIGWNSWGVLQDKLTYDKAIKVADFFADSLKTFRSGNTAYIDLDAYWDFFKKGEDYSKLKEFADYCKAKGLEPGAYWAPFTDWGHKQGGSRKVEGSDYTYADLWTKTGRGYHDIDGARALDSTHPGTQRRIDYFIDHLKACGFKMIKIDFLGHAAIEAASFYDPTVTTGMQAYSKGMEYLVNRLGNQMLIYAAISPSVATGRYVHSRRVACDAFKTIEHTKYTLNSLSYGWWQTYVYNYIDADHVVFGNEPIGANRARLLSALITGTFITGDDFSSKGIWKSRAKEFYQNPGLLRVLTSGKAFQPVDAAVGTGASSAFWRRDGNEFYLAVFNYGKEAQQMAIDFKDLGLNATKIKACTEVIQGKKVALSNQLNINTPAADAALYRFTLAQ